MGFAVSARRRSTARHLRRVLSTEGVAMWVATLCRSLWSSPRNNVWALSGAGKRTAASGVAWSGCASLRGPLCAGEALLEARTQASVALFKLGAHSATLRPEFGGPKSLRCCCAKGVGHRAQLMLRARRGDRENNHPVACPVIAYTNKHHKTLSLSCPHSVVCVCIARLAGGARKRGTS